MTKNAHHNEREAEAVSSEEQGREQSNKHEPRKLNKRSERNIWS